MAMDPSRYGNQAWSNGDALFADPRGNLWTTRIVEPCPTLRRLDRPDLVARDVDLIGWRFLTMILGSWRGFVVLEAGGTQIQAPAEEMDRWTDITLPSSEADGPAEIFGVDSYLADDPEFLQDWQEHIAPRWERLRSPDWIKAWKEPESAYFEKPAVSTSE